MANKIGSKNGEFHLSTKDLKLEECKRQSSNGKVSSRNAKAGIPYVNISNMINSQTEDKKLASKFDGSF